METSEGHLSAFPPAAIARRAALMALTAGLAGWRPALAATPPAQTPPSPQPATPPSTAASTGPLTLRSAAQAGVPVKYAFDDPQRPGLCAEIAAAVQRVDPDLRIEGLDQALPLRRLELMLGNGDLDVFFCLLNSEQRRAHMRFLPVPLYRVNHVVAMRAGDARMPKGWDELRKLARKEPLLLAQGTKLASTLQRADVAFTETARNDRDALMMLVRGRTAAVYGQDLNLRLAARSAGLDQQVRISTQVFEEDVQYAVVSRRLPDAVADRLTDRLKQLVASGEIARLAERYR
ncbi:substrate-binding periplasmic protein [Roseateles chitosanitabidus]|uniref:substrate-binding periplasmic protein n=1 Tax=Roseateles chitosanitabidus TaxID=65048 RepID=UPI000831AD6E|nr:transporter substrate-binding domain-containing protein [Roseateles chitosanitabidus]MBO9687738.1 transporter substrate-binding domain-containing protein [Roseateles chitosanitabidus]